jgi:transcription elongation GreA/GreB family factor
LKVDPGFVLPIMRALAEQARTFQHNRPADALAAALAIDAAVESGLPAPDERGPSAAEVLASAERPAEAVAELGEADLWPGALEALAKRSDAAGHFEALLNLSPAGRLDAVAERLESLGQGGAVARAAAGAVAKPAERLELFLWLWRGPARPPEGLPRKVELLSRLLNAVLELDHDWAVHPAKAKAVRQRVRSALSASDYAAYRQALGEMDEAVAGTIKRLIERTEGLAEAVRDDMMNLLRESFFSLFAKARVDPWLEEGAIWTTEAALRRRQAELKEIEDVKMFQNARAIGAAAAHGDLSENSEWKFALEERDMLRARAVKTREELAKARVLHQDNVPTDSVGIGSRVVLKHVADGHLREIAFLGPWDAEPAKGVYSYQTPLGLELMGRRVGQTVSLKIEGEEGEYVVERIASALA